MVKQQVYNLVKMIAVEVIISLFDIDINFPTAASLSILTASIMSTSDPSCHTVVFESSAEYPGVQELRSGLEKGPDEVKIETLRKIIISTINGNPQASQFDIQQSTTP